MFALCVENKEKISEEKIVLSFLNIISRKDHVNSYF